MKKIICYGDSNTYGYNPKDGSRFNENIRWTSVLQKKLADNYEIINEGVCDRTGFVNNPKGFLYSGLKHFPKFIAKSEKVDLFILWIGTNDLQSQYGIRFVNIEKGLENLINLAKTKTKNIIIIPPVILSEKALEGAFSFQFDNVSIIKSRKIGRIYRQKANANHCIYFDINKAVAPSDVDGLHYSENSHRLIAENLAELIKINFKIL